MHKVGTPSAIRVPNGNTLSRVRRTLGLPQKCVLKTIMRKKCVSVKLKSMKKEIKWCTTKSLEKVCSSVDKKNYKLD